MTNPISPAPGTNSSSVRAAVSTAILVGADRAERSLPLITRLGARAAGKLHLSQPEAAALISSSVTSILDDIAGGGRRDSLIIRATTGVSKTTSAAAAVAAHPAVRAGRLHVVIPVRDHTQSADYAAKLVAGGLPASSVVIYRGRTDADPAKPPALQDPTACYIPDAVREVGSKNHLPAATICRRCPIGIGMSMRTLQQQIANGTAQQKPGEKTPEERLERLEEQYTDALEGSGMDPAHVQRVIDADGCFLHHALRAYRNAQVLIVPQAAYHSSLSEARDALGEPIPDIVIADEDLDLVTERYIINGAAIDSWRTEIQPYANDAGPHYTAADNAIRYVEQLKAERGENRKTIEKFLEFFQAVLKRELARDQKIAWYERAHWAHDGSGKVVAPLRAIVDLEQALRGLAKSESAGAAVVFADDGMHVATITPLGERMIQGNAILLDATIPDSTIAALRAAAAPPRDPEQIEIEGLELEPAKSGGKSGKSAGHGSDPARPHSRIERIDIIVTQHDQLLHLDGRSYGRGLRTAKGYAARLQRHQQHLLALVLSLQAAGTLEQWAILTQKIYVTDALCVALREHGIPEWWITERLGHWGKDDRAHNRWAGLHLIIQSLPHRSHDVLRQTWCTLRALDGRLPVEPSTEYRHETVCADLVQAVGRVRGIYSSPADPRKVIIAARISAELAAMLEGHGLRIQETRDNPLASQKSTYHDLSAPLRGVLERMEAEHQSPTVLEVARAVREAGCRASTQTVLDMLQMLLPATERGPKKLGYQHLPRVYLARLMRWTRETAEAVAQAAERAADAIGEQPLRGLASRLLTSLGSWLGWDPLPSAGLPPIPLPAA